MPDPHAPPRRPRIDRWRIACSRLFGYAILALLLVTGSRWQPYPWLHSLWFLIGSILVAIAVVGRLWCSLYISGYKNDRLITEGPYSLSRNPLYLFSLLGALGVGFATKTLTIPILIGLAFALYYPAVIRAEEAKLRALHPKRYESYARAVPRFWPRHLTLTESPTVEVRTPVFRKAMFSAIWFIVLIGFIEGVERLRDAGALPQWLALW